MGLGLPKFVYRDADAYPYATLIDPAVPGPSIWMLPGLSDIDLARRDFATGNRLSYNGTPTVSAHYTTGKGGTNYFKTGILEPEEFTVCAIFKQDDTEAGNSTRGTLFGTFKGASGTGNLGCICFWDDATTLRFQAYQATNAPKAVTLVPASPTVLHRFTFICTGAAITMYNETDGTTDTEPFTTARQPGGLPFAVLSSNSTTYTGNQGCYSFAMWERALTSDERNAHWAQMALHTARDGVAVG